MDIGRLFDGANIGLSEGDVGREIVSIDDEERSSIVRVMRMFKSPRTSSPTAMPKILVAMVMRMAEGLTYLLLIHAPTRQTRPSASN